MVEFSVLRVSVQALGSKTPLTLEPTQLTCWGAVVSNAAGMLAGAFWITNPAKNFWPTAIVVSGMSKVTHSGAGLGTVADAPEMTPAIDVTTRASAGLPSWSGSLQMYAVTGRPFRAVSVVPKAIRILVSLSMPAV